MDIRLVDDIQIKPDRQRSDLKNIDELADSIEQVGLINPITIDPDNYLIAGERRLTACKMLGWVEIPVHTIDVEEEESYVIEFEENVKRESLDWKEFVRAVGNYEEMTGKGAPEIAESLSMDSSTINKILTVYKHMDRCTEAGGWGTAYNLVSRFLSRKRDEAKATLSADVTTGIAPPSPSKLTVPTAPVKDPFVEIKGAAPFVNSTFEDWLETDYDGVRFNLFHCDFPYGIGVGEGSDYSTSKYGEGYKDSKDIYFHLLGIFCRSMDRLCQPSAHILFWFSMNYYTETMEALRTVGWNMYNHPIIWARSDNQGIMPDPARQPRRIYETCLFGSMGDRKLVHPGRNLHSGPTSKKHHPAEKPSYIVGNILQAFVDETTEMLDPTCGGGTALVAASRRGAKRVLGIERDTEYYNNAKNYWKANN